MAPSRRKGTSKAAAAAAACRQWKVGDLVLAKVKGFPAWPATVSEPEKWGYSRDRKKVLVYFFGTQQIAFCNPVDVEAFTEDKKQSLFVKRRGKGADFIRAVHEIIDCFEKLKTEQPVNGSSTDEVSVRSDNVAVELTRTHLEGEALNTLESSSKVNQGGESEPDFENEAGAVAAKDDMSHDGEMLSVDPTGVEVMDGPATKTYSTRRKIVGGRSRNGAVDRTVPSARRLRSSLRADPEVLQKRLFPSGPLTMNAGYGANTVRDRYVRRNKMDGKLSDSLDRNNMEQSDFVSNGSTEESDSEIATVDSCSVSLNEGSSVESGCKPVYKCAVQGVSEVELSHRLEFQSSAVILKKKRKPNRKRLQIDLSESSAGLDKDAAPEILTARTTDVLPGDPVKSDENNSKELKEDGDEHLPLVKRARVRMGRSAPEGEVLDNEVLNDAKSPGASDKSLEQVPEGDGSCLQNSTCIKSDAYDSSPSKKCSSKRPSFWEIRKQFGGSLDGESALPPSKRLHRALEAMSAYAADDDKQDVDGLCKMKTSINGYCSSSKEVCSELSGGIKVEKNSDADRMRSPANSVQEDAAIVASAKALVAQEGLQHLSDVPALTTPLACDDSSAKVSYEDKCDVSDAVIQTPQKVESSNDCPSSTFVAHSANAESDDGELQGTFKCKCPSPELIMTSDENCENEAAESAKHFEDPISEVSGRSADCGSNDEIVMSSPEKSDMMRLASAEAECGKNNNLCQVSLDVSIQDKDKSLKLKEAGLESKNISVTSSSSPEKVVDASLKELHVSGLSSVSDDQFGDKAVSTTLSSSSHDSFVRISTPNTLTCNMSTVDSSMHVSIGSSSPLPHQLHDKQKTSGKLSSRGEANGALGSFEAALGILTRTKESIGRATRVALDCAKLGVASEVVEIIAQKLENESSLRRRVDLFFLVDSIAQFSRGLKGHIGGIYPSAIQGVLPRLISAAAPPGSSSQENRRQCLKVLRVWQERKIIPESAIRPYIRELESFCGSSLGRGFSRRPMRTERAFDDPIREMEGMLVDEYGSNSSFQLPGFRMPAMLKDEEVSDSDGESFEAVTPEHPAGKPNGEEAILVIEKHKRILEDVDGELEMEDVSPVCEGENASISHSIGTDSGLISRPNGGNSFGASFHPPLPKDGPPSSPPLPSSPPPPPPPPPLPSVMPAPSSFPPPSSILNLAPSIVQSKCSMGSQNIKDNLQETIFQRCSVAHVHLAVSDAIHCQTSDSREIHGEGPLKVLDSSSSRPSGTGAVSHPPFGLSNVVHPPDGASAKGFHLRPPHPAPSNQFSYVHADQRRDISTPYSNVLHMQNGDNRSFSRDLNGIKSARHEIGESWMTQSHYSGPCFPDGSRGHFAGGSYPVPHEPPLPSHKWGFPPRGMNRREIFTHRPPPEHSIPVTSREGKVLAFGDQDKMTTQEWKLQLLVVRLVYTNLRVICGQRCALKERTATQFMPKAVTFGIPLPCLVKPNSEVDFYIGLNTKMGASKSVPQKSIYEFTVKDSKGKNVDLSIYKGKVLLVVNVASKCGFTSTNYTQLTQLYNEYKDKDFEVLAFPCNQFLKQEPGTSEQAQEFACTRFSAEYPIFQKVRVNGPNEAPVYTFLKASKGGFLSRSIKWNFTKFLVDKEGKVIRRYGSTTPPLSIKGDIEKALGEN
ncbi:protein HUA2-LIKE 2 [Solanum lycopersicum]|nr:protein HUA2-LIKE 2 [Solanum lycopersicum]